MRAAAGRDAAVHATSLRASIPTAPCCPRYPRRGKRARSWIAGASSARLQYRRLMRSIAADTLTPIAAYHALATPGAACLLESVESGGRISRYSFIGIDYVQAQSFEDDGNLISGVRSFLRKHGRDALVAFSYDAARSTARLRPRAAVPAMPAAYVAIPRTWLTFDHFTDRLTIESDSESRIDDCLERLPAIRPSFPQETRAAGRMRASLDRQ